MPPLPSPTPGYDPLPDVKTDPGLHENPLARYAREKVNRASVAVEARVDEKVKKTGRRNKVWAGVFAALAGGASTAITGYVHKGEGGGHEERIAAIERRIDGHDRRLDDVQSEVREGRLDFRELYRSMRDGKRSERLERPPPETTKDGGQ